MATQGGASKAGFDVTLPFGPDAARVARAKVRDLLFDQHCSAQLVDDARLVVHELVTNGVVHGAPGAQAEIQVSCNVLASHVIIIVCDGGTQGTVAVRAASADSLNGRGLALVAALSERWSVDRSGGTRVEVWLAR